MKKTILLFFLLTTSFTQVFAQMVLEFDITNVNEPISLPLSGALNVTVDWGDGSSQSYTTSNTAGTAHTYQTPGTKTVTITGSLSRFGMDLFGSGLSRLKKVLSWDQLGLQSLRSAFFNAEALEQVPASLPATVTDLSFIFSNASNFNDPIGTWDVSSVTNMKAMFKDAEKFNQPIGNWNTAKVTDMSLMFSNARAFNQAIGTWNTSSVVDMSSMFSGSYFNQPIGNWNTSQVTNMSEMFHYNSAFNQPIGNWNTEKVSSMNSMFAGAEAFNQPLGDWNTGSLNNMLYMFSEAKAFNQPIGTWNTSHVETMYGMFYGALSFNQPIGNWNTASVRSMSTMFYAAKAFNQPIGNWNTGSVETMIDMFRAASAFDQPIGNWNTENVNNMWGMFAQASSFNQPIGKWNTSKVDDMRFMFLSASAFNQSVGAWNITAVKNMTGIFDYDTLCTAVYDSILTGWSTQNVKAEIILGASGSKHSPNASAAKALLISKGWTINDAGEGINNNCTTISVTDAKENSADTDVQIFPNPSTGWLRIQTKSHPMSMHLTDVLGNFIKTFTPEELNQPLQLHLNQGMYFLHTTINGQKHTDKIIIE